MRRFIAILFVLAVGCQDSPVSDSTAQGIEMSPPPDRCYRESFPEASNYYQISEADALEAEAVVTQFIAGNYERWHKSDWSKPIPQGMGMIASWEGLRKAYDLGETKFPKDFDRAYIGARLNGKDVIYGEFAPVWAIVHNEPPGILSRDRWITEKGLCDTSAYHFAMIYDPTGKTVQLIGYGKTPPP